MAIKTIIGVLVAALLLGVLYIWPTSPMTRTISIGTTTIGVEVADTDALRERGLSGRDSLAEGQGMLFVFDEEGSWGIWMKGMRFAIDIVWLAADGQVITVEAGVLPESYPAVYQPSKPARYVLELPAGYAAKAGIVEGAQIVL